MLLLGYEAQVEARFGPFGRSAQKSFLTHPMELLGDVSNLESHFGSFRDSVSVSAR
jgi:hypothetical protein